MSSWLCFQEFRILRTAQAIIKCSARTMSYTISDSNVNRIDKKVPFVRPFKDIPGPRPLPLIGNTFRFVPYIGEFGNVPLIMQMRMLRDTYGDIVRLEGILNRRKTIFLFNPDLCEKMYRTEGPWPTRIALESLHHYRVNRDCIYAGQYGLTTSQGKQWHDFRSKVNQYMMQPRTTKPHVMQINEVATDFIQKMKELRDPESLELPATFNNEINKWALESICSIALDHRLGCLGWNLAEDSEPQKMINCVHQMFELMYQLELQPSMWKIYNTPDLKKLFRALDTLNGIAVKYVDQAKERVEKQRTNDTRERSILEKLLSVDDVVARVMALDMLTAGVDTTSNAAGNSLYHLACNPRVQEKARKEVTSILPDKSSPITFETVNNIPYVKACIKESLRLSPIVIGTLRTVLADIDIGGYQIPKGSDMVACHSVIGLDSAHYPHPNEFIPERWMRNNEEFPLAKDAHPFSYMPFGFGARTCIGRRFAELEIEVLLLKVLRNFQIEWHHKPLEHKSHFINTIASPLKFKLIDI